MAEIYLARASGLEGFELLAVVKQIRRQFASNREFVEMFLDEARVAATLRHPNVVHVYDVGMTDGRYYFAMEFLHGQDVSSIARAARLRKRLAGTEDAAAARTLKKRVKRAQRARRKALVEAAGGAKAQAKAQGKAKAS